MREHLGTGGPFPDLELPDHTGSLRRLSELAAGDPLFLNFYRGFWWPKEQAFYRGLVRLQDEAEVTYTRFVSVSIDPPEVAAAFRASLDARWTFLSDAERRYQAELGLRETTDTVQRPYLPASFLLSPDLSIHRVWNDYWFQGRPTNEELRQGFRAVTRMIRPDWEVPAR